MKNPVFFESAGDERGTPADFFAQLDAEFHFDIDCAASEANHKCDLWFGAGGIEFDALAADWAGMTCFLNPPYSVAGAFVAKAREEADKGATVVLVLPVRSDTKWWHNYVWDEGACRDDQTFPTTERNNGDWRTGVRCRLLPGRLNFELTVPTDIRAWIKSEYAAGTAANLSMDDDAEVLKVLVKTTGLPKMAISRILEDQPDDCLLDSAPFPSCVVIFTKHKGIPK